jgi:hypothetical protein
MGYKEKNLSKALMKRFLPVSLLPLLLPAYFFINSYKNDKMNTPPNNNRSYAYLMVKYKTPDFIKKLQSRISPEDLYITETSPGLEIEQHVTLVPALGNDTDLGKLKTYLRDLSDYEIELTDISMFDNEDFDVLKSNVRSEAIMETYERITKDFKTYYSYVFQPHMTIAYMKNGTAGKFLTNSLTATVRLEPECFIYSYFDKNGDSKVVYFTE